uniref:Uncharacterized protein n=2 Tax=Methanosarcina barkeri TaxID=2208 RepID=Q466I2_METBF
MLKYVATYSLFMALSYILYNEILRMRDRQLAKEDRVLTAKILVNKVLLGFLNDWKSYSTSDQFWANEDAQYIAFIGIDKTLEYHLDQFVLVATEIGSIGILPDEVSNKLVEFAARMRPMISQSNIANHETWGREYPDSLPNKFDALLIDITDMLQNLDECCDTTKFVLGPVPGIF